MELDALRNEDQLTPDLVLRDPYFLEFLNLNDRYMEKDLEDAIMRELEQFLLELGVGFCFLARQKRMIIDGEDFHLDLLFFHRDLKRLVAIELKLVLRLRNFHRKLRPDFSVQQSAEDAGNLQQVV